MPQRFGEWDVVGSYCNLPDSILTVAYNCLKAQVWQYNIVWNDTDMVSYALFVLQVHHSAGETLLASAHIAVGSLSHPSRAKLDVEFELREVVCTQEMVEIIVELELLLLAVLGVSEYLGVC